MWRQLSATPTPTWNTRAGGRICSHVSRSAAEKHLARPNPALQQPAAAMLVSQGPLGLSAAATAERGRSATIATGAVIGLRLPFFRRPFMNRLAASLVLGLGLCVPALLASAQETKKLSDDEIAKLLIGK